MSSPFSAPILLVVGLLSLFAGERLFGDENMLRAVFDVVGVAGVVASLVTRGRGRELPDEIRRWIAWIHVALVIGLLLYVVQLPVVLAKAGWTEADAERAAREIVGALWPMVLAVATFAALFLDAALISSRRMPAVETLRLRASAQTGTVLGLLVSIFAIGNYLAASHSPEVDLSRRKVGRPSEATVSIVQNLSEPLYVNAFFPPSNEVAEEIGPYLRALETASDGKLVVRTYDHALDPKIAERVNARANGAIYVTAKPLDEGLDEERPPKIPNEKLPLDTKLESARSTLKKFDPEMQKRLLKISRGMRKVYFTTGHGERNPRGSSHVDRDDERGRLSQFNRYLASQGYEVKPFSAADGLASEIPDDAALVVIAGPVGPFLDAEVEALKAYFDRGGSLLVFLEPEFPAGAPADLLDHLGVSYDPAYVANERRRIPATRTLADNHFVFTNKASTHASVTALARSREQLVVLLPRTGSVSKKEGTKRNVQLTLTPLSGSFKDSNANFKKDADENASAGSFAFAAAVEGEKNDDGKSGKAVVVGSTELAGDKWFTAILAGTPGSGNATFVAGAVYWLAGDEQRSAPVATAEEDIPIKHTRKQDTIWFLATIFVFPAMVLAGGLAYVNRSRRGNRARREEGRP